MAHDSTPDSELRAVDLAECCRRLGIAYSLGKELARVGKFPIPELPRLGFGTRKVHRRFSTFEIDLYLREASVCDERELTRLRRVR